MRNKQPIVYILLVYIVASFLWFYLADTFVFTKLKSKPGIVYFLKEAEDLLFIVFTSILLFFLIKRQQKLWTLQELENKSKEEELNLVHLERFNSVTSSTNDILWDWDIENNKVWRNENYEKQLGYPPDETALSESSKWINYLHESDRDKMKMMLENALKGNESYLEGEYRIITKDQRILDIRDRGRIYRDKNGKAIRMVGSMQDITSLRNSQRLLEQSEQLYRKIVESAHEGIWQIDEKGFTTFVNEALTSMLGFSKDEILGKSILDFVFEEDIPSAKEKMKAHLNGIKLQFEFKLKQKNGKAIWILAKGAPVFENGLYKGSIGMISDISTTKEFTKKLQESEQNYKLLFKENPMPMWVYDALNFQFLSVNEAALHHYGYEREEFLKMKVTDIRPSEEIEHFLKENKQNKLQIRNAGIWKHKKKNGELIDVEIVAQTIIYKGVEAHLILINDVTSRVKAEKELLKSYEEIRKLALHLQTVRDDERKRIARDIHDELGQKLTAVKMDLAWLEKQLGKVNSPLHIKIHETLGYVDESNLSIRRILNELRSDFLTQFSAKDAVKWVAAQFEKQNGITVELNIEDDFNELTDEVSNCIYRVIQESLTNISKYANASSVNIHLHKENNNLALCIEDNGKGFDTTSIRTEWSYGLLGMKERLASIDGNLNIQSAPGKGTKLCIKVPLTQIVTV
jgi:PAS domain S-box-containing protein